MKVGIKIHLNHFSTTLLDPFLIYCTFFLQQSFFRRGAISCLFCFIFVLPQSFFQGGICTRLQLRPCKLQLSQYTHVPQRSGQRAWFTFKRTRARFQGGTETGQFPFTCSPAHPAIKGYQMLVRGFVLHLGCEWGESSSLSERLALLTDSLFLRVSI